MDIILYLLNLIQELYQQNCWLINFICKYIPLKQWTHDDSHSPKYQKFKIDELPRIDNFKQDWDWNDLISYYKVRYGKVIKPMFRRVECDIPQDCSCPACNAPVLYLSWNAGKKKSQIRCKVCQTHFSPTRDNRFSFFIAKVITLPQILFAHFARLPSLFNFSPFSELCTR